MTVSVWMTGSRRCTASMVTRGAQVFGCVGIWQLTVLRRSFLVCASYGFPFSSVKIWFQVKLGGYDDGL